MPVDARRLIRKMRGGAQAHLIEADEHFMEVLRGSLVLGSEEFFARVRGLIEAKSVGREEEVRWAVRTS